MTTMLKELIGLSPQEGTREVLRFVNLRKLEQLDELRPGQSVLFDSVGLLTYMGMTDSKMEFAYLDEQRGVIFSIRGSRQEAMLRGSFLDFQNIDPEIYTDFRTKAYEERRKILMGEKA